MNKHSKNKLPCACFWRYFITHLYISLILLQSQLATKEEIEELKSIVVNTEENDEGQGYGESVC